MEHTSKDKFYDCVTLENKLKLDSLFCDKINCKELAYLGYPKNTTIKEVVFFLFPVFESMTKSLEDFGRFFCCQNVWTSLSIHKFVVFPSYHLHLWCTNLLLKSLYVFRHEFMAVVKTNNNTHKNTKWTPKIKTIFETNTYIYIYIIYTHV